MDYKRFDDTILVRMDRGEEILEQVKAVALKEHVALASVQALGAINDFTVGVYNVAEKMCIRDRKQTVECNIQRLGGVRGEHNMVRTRTAEQLSLIHI